MSLSSQLLTSATPIPPPAATEGRIAVKVATVAKLLDCSPSTVRRIEALDPSFPRSFRLHPGGDRHWLTREVLDWLESRAGRPLAA